MMGWVEMLGGRWLWWYSLNRQGEVTYAQGTYAEPTTEHFP